MLVVRVVGHPGPQGSKRGLVTKSGRVAIVESSAEKVKTWRQDVVAAVVAEMRRDGHTTITGVAVRVQIDFLLARPKSHYGTGRNAGLLKLGAPMYPITKPDLDKIVRSTLDALTTATVYRDDAQVARLDVCKVFADPQPTGAQITVSALR